MWAGVRVGGEVVGRALPNLIQEQRMQDILSSPKPLTQTCSRWEGRPAELPP